MAWPTAAALLRDLVAWESRAAAHGGHWPWDPEQVDLRPVEQTPAGTPVARIAGRRGSVRRALWIAVWGDLPSAVHVRGACVEPTCVRPVHGHVELTAGRGDPTNTDTPPASVRRWDAAWPGQAGERRGRTSAAGLHLPHGERRVFGASMAAAIAANTVANRTGARELAASNGASTRGGVVTGDYAGFGEYPGHLR